MVKPLDEINGHLGTNNSRADCWTLNYTSNGALKYSSSCCTFVYCIDVMLAHHSAFMVSEMSNCTLIMKYHILPCSTMACNWNNQDFTKQFWFEMCHQTSLLLVNVWILFYFDQLCEYLGYLKFLSAPTVNHV